MPHRPWKTGLCYLVLEYVAAVDKGAQHEDTDVQNYGPCLQLVYTGTVPGTSYSVPCFQLVDTGTAPVTSQSDANLHQTYLTLYP